MRKYQLSVLTLALHLFLLNHLHLCPGILTTFLHSIAPYISPTSPGNLSFPSFCLRLSLSQFHSLSLYFPVCQGNGIRENELEDMKVYKNIINKRHLATQKTREDN